MSHAAFSSVGVIRASGKVRRMAVIAVAAAFLGACAPAVEKSTPARVEVQQDVGFTIVEEARISNASRSDYEQAMSLLESGQTAQGITLLESMAEAAPLLSAPRIDLGIAYHLAGDLEKAEENLGKALELAPDHPVAHNELGIIYRKTGRFVEARASYEAALAVYPGYHFARRNLAVLCDLYLGDLECALRNYEAYMATVPADDEATMWIADLRLRMDQQARQ